MFFIIESHCPCCTLQLNLVIYSIIGVPLLIVLFVYLYKMIVRMRYKNKANKKFKDSFEQLIQYGNQENKDVIDYMKKNILLQEQIWNDKGEISPKNRVIQTNKTTRQIEMINELKKQYWAIAINILEFEYQSRNTDEIPGIDLAAINHFKDIPKKFYDELIHKKKFNKTKDYRDLFTLLLNMHKMIFMNLGADYKFNDEIKQTGWALYEEIAQKLDNLTNGYEEVIKIEKIYSYYTLNKIKAANLVFIDEMELSLLTCLNFMKSSNLLK
ncbi:hypothetical protein EDEG_02371 [Edhazardia aedis USNM 41457]|uniref:Uncharacterized protein n=1 Tax=Edhazardia aedis (strain USNM 41457) TaxID=1003232 RepID=J9DPJ2_EDHAE|nr:hypothetical protein EDEG_02371 [Edhazardia aedis USNM 41457]|eukprot:EJW03272.1 hypothetical protein EDEG_02371 [Edhazardia aedis USNM 41457]